MEEKLDNPLRIINEKERQGTEVYIKNLQVNIIFVSVTPLIGSRKLIRFIKVEV